jgi:hypothetical protein
MNALSPWAKAVKTIFDEEDLPAIFQTKISEYEIKVHAIHNALWIAVTRPKGAQLIIRAAYAPTDHLQTGKLIKRDDGIIINLDASIGHYEVHLQIFEADYPVIRYTTTFKAAENILVPFWPRDLTITAPENTNTMPEGTVHVSQVGTRSGLQYFTLDKPKSGAVLYFQNLTALNEYAQYTETSLGNVVGGNWPELGFALPPTIKDKPIPAGKAVILSDAFLAFSPDHPKNEFECSKQFLNMLAAVYLQLPRPETQYQNWPDVLDKGLHDLEFSHGCWSHGAEQDYLNAYVADYKTPPEIMVQLAVLLPLTDYHDWCKTDLPAITKIKNGLDAFYNKKLGTIMRFLPALANELDGSEEQLKPNVMDSWYLHHPLLNLGRLALRGDKQGKKLFLDSLDFTIRVAGHFNYEWPVMYNMETLEVVKAETQPGKGGEKDVAGLYSLVMLHAWELTKENKYLLEAKKAAKTLHGKGFELFYQANNTAFSANAMLWLFKETKEQLYLDLAYLCIANIFKNFQLWECNYGYAKDYATFFAMFPLNDAPYTAAYEEQEVFAALHNFLRYAEKETIMPSVSLLIPEFLRYILNRAAYYYPPNLPAKMLAEKTTKGQLDHKLWIAIEDIHDGWEKSGTVGQEVYGAGVAFGIVPRHFYRVPKETFMIYCDYPTFDFEHGRGRVSMKLKGDERLSCRLMILKKDNDTLPEMAIYQDKKEITKTLRRDGNIEYAVFGNSHIKIIWKKKEQTKLRKKPQVVAGT